LGRDFAADTACLALGGPFDYPAQTITDRKIYGYEHAGDRLRPNEMPTDSQVIELVAFLQAKGIDPDELVEFVKLRTENPDTPV
jgi:hypothetical protein